MYTVVNNCLMLNTLQHTTNIRLQLPHSIRDTLCIVYDVTKLSLFNCIRVAMVTTTTTIVSERIRNVKGDTIIKDKCPCYRTAPHSGMFILSNDTPKRT